MNVTDKRTAYYLWVNNGLGNKLRTWSNIDEYLNAKYSGKIGIRYSDPRGGGSIWAPFVTKQNVKKVVRAYVKKGYDEQYMVFCEMAPDHLLTMNGEVNDMWHMWYSHVQKPMRHALKEGGQYANSVRARMLAKIHMNEVSYEDLLALMEIFPGHTIEFSCYPFCLGNTPGRNVIFWEVRKY